MLEIDRSRGGRDHVSLDTGSMCANRLSLGGAATEVHPACVCLEQLLAPVGGWF